MKLVLIIAASLLAGCGEQRCVDGKMAYKVNGGWMWPSGAYACKEDLK